MTHRSTLAALHYRKGDPAAALDVLNQIPNPRTSTEDWLFMTLSWHALGNREMAEQCFAKAEASFADRKAELLGSQKDSQVKYWEIMEIELLFEECHRTLNFPDELLLHEKHLPGLHPPRTDLWVHGA